MPQKAIDMTGMKIGRLTVISRADNTNQNKAQWLCVCDCGNKVIVSRRHLKDFSTVSCGCYRSELAKENNSTHKMKGTRIYRIWSGIKDRCCNQNSKYWYRYGARGITVCDEWKNSFEQFYQWSLDNGYRDNLTLDRIDNNKGYYTDNCRWATYKEQENNRSNNRILEYEGETHTISQWSEIVGIEQRLISQRLYYGWSVKRALTELPKRRNKICRQN